MQTASLSWFTAGTFLILTLSTGPAGASYCSRAGQRLLHSGNRCQYVHCTYRTTRYDSAIVGITRQCPPGTAVPRGLYVGRNRKYFPMNLCSERTFGRGWAARDCSVPQMAFVRRRMRNYRPLAARKMRAYWYPEKRFYAAKKSYYHSHLAPRRIPFEIEAPKPASAPLPMMLNDLPDDITQVLPFGLELSPESKMAATTADLPAEPVYQNEVDVAVAPPGGGTGTLGDDDYQMDPEEEAAILRSLHKLPSLEQSEVMSDEDANKVKQEIMDLIFGDL